MTSRRLVLLLTALVVILIAFIVLAWRADQSLDSSERGDEYATPSAGTRGPSSTVPGLAAGGAKPATPPVVPRTAAQTAVVDALARRLADAVDALEAANVASRVGGARTPAADDQALIRAIPDAIAEIARAACADPTLAPAFVEKANELLEERKSRAANGVIVGLGRCGDASVLAVLIEWMRSESAATSLRATAIASLAQPREPEPQGRSGDLMMGIEDAFIRGPIAEADVRAALLDFLAVQRDEYARATRPKAPTGAATHAVPSSMQLLPRLIGVLGASAAIDDRVLDELLLTASTVGGLDRLVVNALRMARGSRKVADYAASLLEKESDDPEHARAAEGLLAGNDPVRGLRTALRILASDEYTDVTKFGVVSGAEFSFELPVAEVGLLESLCQRADEWSRRVPKIELTARREGPELVRPERRTSEAVSSLVYNANARFGTTSPTIRSLAVAALIRTYEIASPDRTARDYARLTKYVVESGGPSVARELLEAAARSALSPTRLAALLVDLHDAVKSASAWAELSSLVDALLTKLPADLREKTAASLAASK